MTSEPNASQPKTPKPLILAVSENPIQIVFHWRGDRFAHALLLDDAEVGHSVESNAEESWPVSPPIQQLSLEEIDGALVALGVGAAGQSHWSISVQTEKLEERIVWKFDLACRCKSDPVRLASTYRLDSLLCVEPTSTAVLQSAESGFMLQPKRSSGQDTYRWSYLIGCRHRENRSS